MFVNPIPPPKRPPDLAGSAYGFTVLRFPKSGGAPPLVVPAPLPKRDVGALGGASSSFAFYSGSFVSANVPPDIGLKRGTFSPPSLGYPKGLEVIALLACC